MNATIGSSTSGALLLMLPSQQLWPRNPCGALAQRMAAARGMPEWASLSRRHHLHARSKASLVSLSVILGVVARLPV